MTYGPEGAHGLPCACPFNCLCLWLAKPSVVPSRSQLFHEDFSSSLALWNSNLCYASLTGNLRAGRGTLRLFRDLIQDQKLSWNSSLHQECFCSNDCSGRHCTAGGGHSEIVWRGFHQKVQSNRCTGKLSLINSRPWASLCLDVCTRPSGMMSAPWATCSWAEQRH